MSSSTSKKKRAAQASTPTTTTSQSNVINNLLDSYEFIASHEYSEKTIGIPAFLLRKSVGDINFSDVIDDSEKRTRQGQTASCVSLLEDKRRNLQIIEASLEKCLMLTRLINYIQQNESQFTSLISDVRLDMQFNMTDPQSGPCPIDYRKRENDFIARQHAQQVRRLFYHSHDDVKAPNLVYLQNRTTEQLNNIHQQMSRDSKSRQVLSKELENILRTSFMVVAQPHSGLDPVTIYERRGPGEYTAKVSVTIISLLHDFMQLNPNLIELYDIEPSLCPASTFYKLEEPRAISWKTCQIQTPSGGKSHMFLCAELSTIIIEQSSKTDTRVRFAQALHSLVFAIKLQFNLVGTNNPIYQFGLESLPFAIGAHNNQIPQLLTRVLLDDIRRFTKMSVVDAKVVQNYMQRYFIHRTGVQPNECMKIYLEQELTRAMNQRSNFESLEDIYLDFLVNFVHQVEFMAKHPILSMFHADGLFLGICSSERAAEATIQSSVNGSPVIALRFNSIRIDYSTIASLLAANRAVKLAPCAIRVDIYNARTNKIQNRTFDSGILATDISKFVTSASTENADRILVLSIFDDRSNDKACLPFREFAKYFHPRLQDISKSDEKYKPITDLVENANDGNIEDDVNDATSDVFSFAPNSVTSLPPRTPSFADNEQSLDGHSSQGFATISYENCNPNIPSSVDRSQQPQPSAPSPYTNNQETLLKLILSQPNLAEQVLRQYKNVAFNTTTPVASPQQQQQQSPMPYSVQPPPYRQQAPVQVRQMPFQQTPIQPMYHQPQAQMYHPSQMQYQQPPQPYFTQNQPQVVFQQPIQQSASPSVVHYLPNNPNQTTFVPQTQQLPVYQTNGTGHVPPQFLEQMNFWNISDPNSTQTTTSSIQQPVKTEQSSIDISGQELPQLTDLDIDRFLAEFVESETTENHA